MKGCSLRRGVGRVVKGRQTGGPCDGLRLSYLDLEFTPKRPVSLLCGSKDISFPLNYLYWHTYNYGQSFARFASNTPRSAASLAHPLLRDKLASGIRRLQPSASA